MVDYRDRTGEIILLIAPSGQEFEALWRGNPRSITNKLGIHEFPGIRGARVQDLRPGADLYPLTIMFEGKDHDFYAEQFMESLKLQAGNWESQHPTKGPKFLTLIDAVEQIQPVTSGGITIFETNWIEPLPESEAESLAQAQAQGEFRAGLAFDVASSSFFDVFTDAAAQIQSVISTVGSVITSVKKKLKLIENFSILSPQILAIEASINNTLNSPILDTTALAGQLQGYIRIFGLGQNNSTNAIEMYSSFADEIVKDVPSQATDEGLSKMSVTEMVASFAVASASEMALIGGVESRSKLITTIQKLNDMNDNVANALDATQEIYGDNFIDKRYFSQLNTYKTTSMAVSASSRFLLLSLFGLPSERRIILKTDTSTPQVAYNEYGSIGDETDGMANIDKLISSNGFMNDQIYLLESGTEVLIYQ